MTPPLDLLCARLVNLGYVAGFLNSPELADFSFAPGRTLKHTIWGDDPGLGKVPYGLVTSGPEGTIASIRGTQVPKTKDGLPDFMEWVRNFEALLVRCPLAPGCLWHDGIGEDYLSLTIEDGTPIGKALAGDENLISTGHSKGGPLSMYLALEVGIGNLAAGLALPACIAFAPCKPGDRPFGDALISRTRGVRLWANPKDIVPHTPLTIKDLPPPLVNEDYEFPTPLYPIDPNSVSPAVPLDWDHAHNLAGCYIRCLEAA